MSSDGDSNSVIRPKAKLWSADLDQLIKDRADEIDAQENPVPFPSAPGAPKPLGGSTEPAKGLDHLAAFLEKKRNKEQKKKEAERKQLELAIEAYKKQA